MRIRRHRRERARVVTLVRLLEVLTVSYLSRSPPGPGGARLVSGQAASWRRARACALATLM